jgi:hypothetical protein
VRTEINASHVGPFVAPVSAPWTRDYRLTADARRTTRGGYMQEHGEKSSGFFDTTLRDSRYVMAGVGGYKAPIIVPCSRQQEIKTSKIIAARWQSTQKGNKSSHYLVIPTYVCMCDVRTSCKADIDAAGCCEVGSGSIDRSHTFATAFQLQRYGMEHAKKKTRGLRTQQMRQKRLCNKGKKRIVLTRGRFERPTFRRLRIGSGI